MAAGASAGIKEDDFAAVPLQDVAGDAVRFLAIGDWGAACTEARRLAAAMAASCQQHQPAPAAVLALGDNFYPSGVMSVNDAHFQKTWENVYLPHPALRIPWMAVLGNHDYMGYPMAQVQFSTAPTNPHGGLWKMPSRNYRFGFNLPSGISVEFFVLDTNGCQWHVQGSFPDQERIFKADLQRLSEALQTSKSTVKIVVGHHPLYTSSHKHGRLAQVLRSSWGYDLERILVEGGVCAYFSGHEHVFQHHQACGIQHFVCGASIEYGFYGGLDEARAVDWCDMERSLGFVDITIAGGGIDVVFRGVHPDRELHAVHIPLSPPPPPPPPSQSP